MKEKRVKCRAENGFPRPQLSILRRTKERLAIEGKRLEAAISDGEIQALFRDGRLSHHRRGGKEKGESRN